MTAFEGHQYSWHCQGECCVARRRAFQVKPGDIEGARLIATRGAEGHTPTRIRTERQKWSTFSGHLTEACNRELDRGPGCPQCLASRLPDNLVEHSWPWEPRVGPEAVLVPVSEDHSEDVVRWGGTAQ